MVSRFDKAVPKNRAAEIANTFEWMITAFILVFVFRAFVMEAFRIPTGSMADTLKGDHFRLRCRQCGYKYDYGFTPENYGFPQDTIPRSRLQTYSSRCPSCGYYQPTGGTMQIANGDRIFVLKCIYQFFEPKRWDVIVFKNPLDPPVNYIKRLVGLPMETVEIIDGDVYINGLIARKPPKVQNELWMLVYDNDYQPVHPRQGYFNGHIWQQPFKNIAGSSWAIARDNPTVFGLDSPADEVNWLVYDTSTGNDFRTTYAYNDVEKYSHMPYGSDLKIRFYAGSAEMQGRIGAELSKYQAHYRAWVNLATFEMVITKSVKDKEPVELVRKHFESVDLKKPALFEFANVDHQLIFQFGGQRLSYDLGRGSEDTGRRQTDIAPQVKIFGWGKLTLSHIAIFRDIHYTAINGPGLGTGTQGNPITLAKDEFFVLGDNSPNSSDGRWWSRQGRGNNGRIYRVGIVPRDYLVGKALFVYWPSGFNPPWPQKLRTFLLNNSHRNRLFYIANTVVSLNWIPNIGQARFIYGGRED